MCTNRFCLAAALLALLSVASYAPAQGRDKARLEAADDREVVREEGPAHAGASYRAKEVLGAKVQVEGERSVGTVDDIVLDDNGNVDYLIVMTADKDLVTVPWDAAVFQPKQRIAKISISPEKFEKVPTYTTEKYPVFTPEYRTQTYKYYGLTPGQARRAVRRGAAVVR
jgi:hypothetical protein